MFATDRVVIATGGVGGLFLHTNPAGLARASRWPPAPALLWPISNLFNSTRPRLDIAPIASAETDQRGGAWRGDPDRRARRPCFMASPRPARNSRRADVVARGVAASGGRIPCVSRRAERRRIGHGAAVPDHHRICRAAGIDPVTQAILIRPPRIIIWAALRTMRRIVGRRPLGLWRRSHAPVCMAPTGSPAFAVEAAVCGVGRISQPLRQPHGVSRAAWRRRSAQRSGCGSSDPVACRRRPPRCRGLRSSGGRGRFIRRRSHNLRQGPAIVGLMIVMSAPAPPRKPGRDARTDFPEHASPARRSTLRLADALQAVTLFPIPSTQFEETP